MSSEIKARTVAALPGLAIAVFSAAALADRTESLTSGDGDAGHCQSFQNTRPLCFFSNPEDLALVPGDTALIVSEYGDHYGTQPGALVFYDYEKQQRRVAYDIFDTSRPAQYWGESACTQPPGKLFSPHGIDLSQRTDGRWQLLVVQHGGRESVEFFELTGTGDDLKLMWRGCALAPEKASLNSVASGHDDEFFTTKMVSTDVSWQGEQIDPQRPTGLVYRWSKHSGFEPVPGSEGVMPNGIAASSDRSTIYVVYSGENLLKKIDAKSGTVLAATTVRAADNVKWSADGKSLVAASFVGSASTADFTRCGSSDIGICPIPFAVVELDPGSLSQTKLFENPDAPMGAGTVGLKVGSTLFIGTFSGNRILQVDLSQAQE